MDVTKAYSGNSRNRPVERELVQTLFVVLVLLLFGDPGVGSVIVHLRYVQPDATRYMRDDKHTEKELKQLHKRRILLEEIVDLLKDTDLLDSCRHLEDTGDSE